MNLFFVLLKDELTELKKNKINDKLNLTMLPNNKLIII